MTNKNGMWVVLALCGSLLIVAAPTATQAADPPAKSKAKQDIGSCRYIDSPGSRIKRHVCGTPAPRGDEIRMPTTGSSFASPPAVVPGMSDFGLPANQNAYKGYR
jgi:hypothetical protein